MTRILKIIHVRIFLSFILATGITAFTDHTFASTVGRIPGTFSVNPAGALTYTIPFEFPVGVNNMQPSISLVYNSHAGNGLAGWGWSLSGLSSIMRTQKKVYYDGVEKDISWSNQDSLVLDGQRMMLVKRTTDYHEYRLESDPTFMIRGYHIQSWGPSYFKVFSKSGLTMTYGSPQIESSYILMYKDAANGTDPVKAGWNLIEVEDANGNFMKIDYYNSYLGYKGNAIYKITYGGNKHLGTPGNLHVFFQYTSRADAIQSYIAGKESLQELRLSKVYTKIGTSIQKEYRLSYQSGNISRLSSIGLYNRNIKQYEPLEFTYGEKDATESNIDISFIKKDASGNEKDKKSLVAVDLDGDGYNELGDIYYKDESLSDKMGIFRHYFEIHRKSNNWGKDLPRENEYFPVAFAVGSSREVYQSSIQELFADFNGNRSAESTFFYFENTALNVRITDRSDQKVLREESLQSTQHTPFIATGNYQGNPLANALILYNDPHAYPGGGYSYRYDLIRSNVDGFVKSAIEEMYVIVPKKIIYATTVNLGSANYRDDLWLLLEDGNAWIVKNNQKHTFFADVTPLNTGLKIGEYTLHRFGDMNGDGLVDVVYREGNKNWFIGYNRGDGTFTSKPININCSTSLFMGVVCDKKDDIILVDINNDGLTDLIAGDESDSKPTYWRFYLNEGNGSFSLWRTEESPEKPPYSCFADLLGKGSINWAHAKNDGKVVITDFGFDVKKNLLTKVSNPLSPPLELKYKPMAACTFRDGMQDGINYCHSYKEYLKIGYLPFKSTQFPVVAESKEGYSQILYDYGTSLINWTHRGNMGFRYLQEKDLQNNLTVETRNKIHRSDDGKYNVMLPYRILHYQGNRTSSHNAHEQHDHLIKVLSGKRFALQQNKYSYSNNIFNQNYTEKYTYDTYNNITSYVKNSERKTLRKTSEYAQKSSWCPNVLTKETITEQMDEDSLTKIHLYDYDTKGNLISQNTDYGTPGALVIHYENINAFGRPEQIRRTANSQNRISTLTYSESGRFITKETNELGDTISRTWNEERGLLQSESTRIGKTTYFYDNYNNVSTIQYPLGRIRKEEIQWAVSGRVAEWYVPDCKYYTTTTIQGESPVTICYNTYGQEIARKVTGFNARNSYTFTTYRADGKVLQVSKPTFNSSPTATDWIETYDYDPYGRVTTIESPRGNTSITYWLDADYDGYTCLHKTITTPGTVTETYHDVSGTLRQSLVNGKLVYFKYTVGEKIKSAHPEESSPITFKYDRNANRIQIDDPTTGRITSEYDAWNQLTKESQQVYNNSSGLVISWYTYQANGLMTQRNRYGTHTTYEYDSQNRLKRIYDNESEKSFTYGSFDLITQIQTVINGKTLSTRKEYNSLGQLTKYTYPSGYSIHNTYDTYGNLVSVTDTASRQIWEQLSCDAEGRVLTEKKGGIICTYRYTDKGQLDSIGAPGIADMRYSYYPSGNLKSYKDGISNQAENYTYDALDRLASWKKPGGGALPYDNIEYDSKNRITETYDYLISRRYYNYKPSGNQNSLYYETNCDMPEQTLTYTTFKKVKTIRQGDYTLTFSYDPEDKLLHMKTTDSRGTRSERYYAENYIEDRKDYFSTRHYIYGGNGLAALHTSQGLYNVYTDLLGSVVVLAQGSAVRERYAFDPWGNTRDPQNWTQKKTFGIPISIRGYTQHEHLDEVGLINMNARLYDPHTYQFLSPDPHLQDPTNWLNYNRYSYCLNNPLKYSDPSGEIALWVIPVLAATLFGTMNLTAHAIRGDIGNVGDGFKYFGQGALTGFAWGCAYQFAPHLPIIGKGLQDMMTAYAYSQVAIGTIGVVEGGINEGWNGIVNGMKIFYGNFYLDENDFWGGVIKGLSRHTWELPQTFVGNIVSQVRNSIGFADRVDYLGGATFVTNEDANKKEGDGITFGNFININIRGKITGGFDDYVTNSPLYMHEYGHTVDSRAFGLSYLFAIGLPSLISAKGSSIIPGKNPDNLTSHSVYWTETRANRRAAKYFGKHYGVNWNFQKYPLNNKKQ